MTTTFRLFLYTKSMQSLPLKSISSAFFLIVIEILLSRTVRLFALTLKSRITLLLGITYIR